MSSDATYSQTLDTVIMYSTLAFGIIYFGFATTVFSDYEPKCPEPLIGTGWTVIQVLGLCMFGLGLSYIICTLSRSTCYMSGTTIAPVSYAVMYFILNLIIFIFAIIIFIKYKSLSEKNDKNINEVEVCGNTDNNHKRYVVVVLVVSIIIILVCLYVIANHFIQVSREEESAQLLQQAGQPTSSSEQE